VTSRILELAGANGLMLLLGAGLLPLLRLAHSRRELVVRLPLAYAIGLVTTGSIAAELTVISLPVRWTMLSILAVLVAALGLRRLERGTWRSRAPRLRELPALAVLAVAGPLSRACCPPARRAAALRVGRPVDVGAASARAL
jgi:hypothetical protein